MASIEEHGSGWRVVWRRAGVKQRTIAWPTPEVAERAAAIARAARHNITSVEVEDIILGPAPPTEESSSAPRFRDFSADWLAAKTRITPGTRAGYQQQFESRIWPAFGDKRLDEIDGLVIGRFLNDLRLHPPLDENGRRRKSVKRNGTVTRYYSLVFGVFTGAKAAGHVSANPCQQTDFVRNQVEADDTGADGAVYLTEDEYGILRRAFEPIDRPLLDFLVGTGVRWSEATAVGTEHLRLRPVKGNPEVDIWRAWKPGGPSGPYLGTTKGRNKRTLDLADDLVDTVGPLVLHAPRGSFLFRLPSGEALNYKKFYRGRWRPAVIRAMRCAAHPPARREETLPGARGRCGTFGGVTATGRPCGKFVLHDTTRCEPHSGPAADAVSDCDCPTRLHRRPTPHDLRHTFVSWQLAAGVSMRAIQLWLGHRHITTTIEVYGGLQPSVRDKINVVVGAALRTARGAPARLKATAPTRPVPVRPGRTARRRVSRAARTRVLSPQLPRLDGTHR